MGNSIGQAKVHEPQVGVNALMAWGLWMGASALLFAGTTVVALGHPHLALALYAHSMMFMGGAATVTVGCYMRRNRRLIADAIAHIASTADDGGRVHRLVR